VLPTHSTATLDCLWFGCAPAYYAAICELSKLSIGTLCFPFDTLVEARLHCLLRVFGKLTE